MIQALNIAASGIRFGLTKLDAAANDVANSQTEGYEPKDVIGVEDSSGGVRPAVVPGVDDGLAADLVQSIIAKHSISANAAMFKRADGVVGELVDLLG